MLIVLGCWALCSCDRQSANQAQPAPAQTEPTAAAANGALPMVAKSSSSGGELDPNFIGIIDRSHRGEVLPDTDIQNLNGKALPIRRLAGGKPFLLNLWATWCAPCVAEMPTFDALKQRVAGKMDIILVSQDLTGQTAVKPFWAAHPHPNLTPYTDPELHLSRALGHGDETKISMPTTMLYNADGREVWRMSGAMNWIGEPAAKLLAEAH